MARPVANPDSGAVSGVTFRDTAYKSRQIILDDGRVFDQCTFHVERADPVAGGGDHIVAAPDKADTAIAIELSGITG